MIAVTKPYLPNRERLNTYIDEIYASGWLTNNGPLLQRLECRLKKYLNVKHLILVANGSLALQLAYKALDLKGDVITSPFSFAATSSTLAWEGLNPIFVDIDKQSLNIDPFKIKEKITPTTSAILPVHVFGNPCDVEEINIIARNHNLKVIYDAAHAFDVTLSDSNILNYGDISTLSFHATKLFHSVEGGAVITNDDSIAKKIRSLMNFGIEGTDKINCIGTNAKLNEFEAAMGLSVLDELELIKAGRKQAWLKYNEQLKPIAKISWQSWHTQCSKNYSYLPIVFDTEATLLNCMSALNAQGVFPRRYFHPSLDTIGYSKTTQVCEISRDISSRILCLPLHADLSNFNIDKICSIIKENI